MLHFLQQTPPTDWPLLDKLAAELRLSTPTLRRKLRMEGLTYRAIKNELRRSLIMENLQTGRVIGDVSAQAGFSEPSAFYRAFRKWTGDSPAAFRRTR